ncbi:hypothetical protein LUZ60_011829 [Juncus effusus]|nr:hypothetical protein LUZ60_011829 [Juncus effusus]
MSLTNSRSRTIKSRLASGETLYGCFILSTSPTMSEIAALAGYDFIVLDMEHGPGGIPEALHCLQALSSTNTPVIIRVPEISHVWALKALDLGPHGIWFPSVESAKSAELAVSYCRYPPRGVRGTAHSLVRQSAYGFDSAYLSHCEEDLLIMCQVETEQGLQEAEAIATVDGVDVVQMGPTDLGASMGYISDLGNKKVADVLREAERKVLRLTKKNGGVYLGGIAMPHDPPEQLKRRGYHMVAGGADIGLFRQAAIEDVKRFQIAVTEIAEKEEQEQ